MQPRVFPVSPSFIIVGIIIEEQIQSHVGQWNRDLVFRGLGFQVWRILRYLPVLVHDTMNV